MDADTLRLLGRWAVKRLDYSVSAQLGKTFAMLFIAAPRESIQAECMRIHRRFTVRAHTARKRAEEAAETIIERLHQ